MKIRSFLLLCLFLPAQADDTALFTLETYSVPSAIWLKIPTSMRDDHALLRTNLIEQLPKGTITRRDQIGGSGRSSQRLSFEAREEVFTPFAFGTSGTGIYPLEWQPRKIGSFLELDSDLGKSARLDYRRVEPDAEIRPLLASGRRLNIARVGAPMFSVLRLDIDAPIVPVSLVAVGPDPDRQQWEKRLLVCFLVTRPLPDNEGAARRLPGYTLELFGLRGSTRTAELPPLRLMTDLLRRSDALVFSLVTTQVPGRRASLEAVQEFPYPGGAELSPAGPFPNSVAIMLIGTILSAQLAPITDGKISAIIQIDHDWREPILPSVPGESGAVIDISHIPYVMQLRVREVVEPGVWSLLAEQPLSEILGPDDRETKGESCYLFGRIVIRN